MSQAGGGLYEYMYMYIFFLLTNTLILLSRLNRLLTLQHHSFYRSVSTHVHSIIPPVITCSSSSALFESDNHLSEILRTR